jgi:hypothetical protein
MTDKWLVFPVYVSSFWLLLSDIYCYAIRSIYIYISFIFLLCHKKRIKNIKEEYIGGLGNSMFNCHLSFCGGVPPAPATVGCWGRRVLGSKFFQVIAGVISFFGRLGASLSTLRVFAWVAAASPQGGGGLWE